MAQTDSIVKVLWGTVNAAYSGFLDLAEAATWAQANGYKTLYIPAGEYLLDDKTIEIHTPGFTLQGAGEGSTILKASRTYDTASEYAIVVQPEEATRIEHVRLAGFTVQVTDEGVTHPYPRQGGIYLKDCQEMWVEHVRSNSWESRSPAGYGFKAENTGADPEPAGRIAFNQCGEKDCFYGVWLTGAQPMQRCSIADFRFAGKSVSGVITGVDYANRKLIDTNAHFTSEVLVGDIVFDETPPAGRWEVENVESDTTLVLIDTWNMGMTYQVGDSYSVVPKDSYSIYIDKAKATLVLGGEANHYWYGIHVKENLGPETQLSQIIGFKFGWCRTGVYIGANAKKTQVLGVAHSGALYHIEDHGSESVVVSHQVESGFLSSSLILCREMNQFPVDVDVYGLLDAAVKQAAGAGIRTYLTDGPLSQVALNEAFDNPDDGFIGVYVTTAGAKLLVTKIGGLWYKSTLSSV